MAKKINFLFQVQNLLDTLNRWTPFVKGDEVDLNMIEIEKAKKENLHTLFLYRDELSFSAWEDLVRRFPDNVDEDKIILYLMY